MNIRELIAKDRNKSIDPAFTDKVIKKMSGRQKDGDLVTVFLKKHLWMSIAAGIVLGLVVSGVWGHSMENKRPEQLRKWMECHYMNEMELEILENAFFM